MSDSVATTPAAPAIEATPKKAAKVKTPKKALVKAIKAKGAKPAHPPTGEMVNAAIAALKERSGSSLMAIKKYIAATYKVDVTKQATFIKKYLKSAVEKKTLIQTKGTGAAGSFKLATKAVPTKKTTSKPKSAVKKPVAAKKTVVKPASGKKLAAKKTATKKVEKPKAAKPKSPSKAKKTGKAPVSKPRAPKPKKASAPKAKAAAKK